jgi:hypothetical protein
MCLNVTRLYMLYCADSSGSKIFMHLKKDALDIIYNEIKQRALLFPGACTINILVNPEIDSLCALRILVVVDNNSGSLQI